MESIVDFLQNVDLLSLLTKEEINKVIKNMHRVEIGLAKTLFREGDEGSELFIILHGKVASFVTLPNGYKREIAEFIPGDFFGEMSIFENANRSATCYTKEGSSLLSLKERDLFELILYNPEIAVKIMYKMLTITTARLLDRSEFLSDMVQWGEDARKRAITDELTGIYNRRFLDDALEDHFQRAKNNGIPLSLVMIDIDNFRQISETFGQKIVDKIIFEIVAVFKKIFRENDIVARFGGDEFTVIMPNTDIDNAKQIAEKICISVSGLKLSEIIDNRIPVITISQGVASYPKNANDVESLKKAADDFLYKAKYDGKNRVTCSK